MLLETDAGESTVVQYTLSNEVYGDLLSQRRSGSSNFFHFDALGSTDRLTNAAGTVTDSYTCYAFGQQRASSGTTTNPYRYVGRLGYYRNGTELLYLRARYYDSGLGRLLSAGAVDVVPGGYPYAANGPSVSVDPTGGPAKGKCKNIANYLGAATYMSKTRYKEGTCVACAIPWKCNPSDCKKSFPAHIGCSHDFGDIRDHYKKGKKYENGKCLVAFKTDLSGYVACGSKLKICDSKTGKTVEALVVEYGRLPESDTQHKCGKQTHYLDIHESCLKALGLSFKEGIACDMVIEIEQGGGEDLRGRNDTCPWMKCP